MGDIDPRKICLAVGGALSDWENAEIAYSYLFNNLTRPQILSSAIRRAYGSVISVRSRREMIEAAAQVFFHEFPSTALEAELRDILNFYMSAAARRNDFAHGVVLSWGASKGWYLEANMYSNKRSMTHATPYAYTSEQISKIASGFSRLTTDVNDLRDELQAHFRSCDPTRRARY